MLLSAFFVCMSLLGLARILDGTIAGSLFGLLQDALVLLGGLFLVQFAYHFPRADSPRGAGALVAYSFLAILSFGTIIFLAIAAYRHPAGYIEIPEYYWYLMPLAIVLAIGFYLRRSLFYASLPDVSSVGWRPRIFQSARALIHPPNNLAAAHRNLALAISVGILQAMASIGLFPGVFGQYMIGIGGILVVSSIALVYYSHALKPIGFTARLIGISLTGLLIFSGISGIYSITAAITTQNEPLLEQVQIARQAITENPDAVIPQLSLAAYIVSWPEPTDYQLTDLQVHFLAEDITRDDLDSVQGLGGPFVGLLAGAASRFAGVEFRDYHRFRLEYNHRIYEIGFPWMEYARPILRETNRHIVMTVLGSLFVLLFFPLFFQRHLLNPLGDLLQGVRQADKGHLDTTLPIQFEDEIGSITRSFNGLLKTLKASNQHRDEYSEELKKANEEMEQRIAERTRELSETNEQLQIARDEAEQTAVLGERQRLARDLHDAITRSLYGVMLFARAGRDAQEVGDQAKLEDNLMEIETNALQTLKEIRVLLHQLRPLSLEHGGLPGAIDQRFDQVERRLGIAATANFEDNLSLSRKAEESIYLITTEALNNSLKHSHTKSVHVRLGRENGNIQLIVEDNGQGFDPSKPTVGMGLNNMRERADLLGGEIDIETNAGTGTRVRLSMPESMKKE